jgi:hypothetical protein
MCCARSFVDFFAVEVMTLSMEGGPDRWARKKLLQLFIATNSWAAGYRVLGLNTTIGRWI